MIMSFKSFINYITESIVDQYKAVRAAARAGDELMRKTHGTAWPQSSSLQSYIDGRQPPTISAEDRYNAPGYYYSYDQSANTKVNDIRNFSWERKVNTNSHELAHAAQHAAQFRDNAISSPDADMKRSQPKFWMDQTRDMKNWTRSDRRKFKRNQKMWKTGLSHLGPKGVPEGQNTHQYMNTDIEVGARAIGHAAEHLDIRSDPTRPDTSAHMAALANELAKHHTNHFFTKDGSRNRASSDPRNTDIPSQRQAVQSAIENLRRSSLARFRKSEEDWHASADMQPRTLKKGMHIYGRLIQHHEEELPTDIHTPEGRDAFIRTHGTRGDIAMMDQMNKDYAK